MGRKSAADVEKVKEEILNGAEKMFVQLGFHGASMSMIANEANVVKSTLHHHFINKENLWENVKSRAFKKFFTNFTNKLSGFQNAEELIEKTMREYFHYLQDNNNILRLLWWNQCELEERLISQDDVRDDTFSKMLFTNIKNLTGALKHFRLKGEVREDVDPIHLYMICLGSLRHWFVAKLEYEAAFLNLRETDVPMNFNHLEYLETTIKLMKEVILKK